MTHLHGIIMDMDGTIADTETRHWHAFNEAFLDSGLDYSWSWEDYIYLLKISGGEERILYFFEERHGRAPKLAQLAREIHQKKSRIYRHSLSASPLSPRIGVARLLVEARKKQIRLAVATSSSRANFDCLMAHTGLNDLRDNFDVVITSDEAAKKKPDPDCYRAALKKMGCLSHNCIAIEDTRNGNLAALAAGLRTVITTHSLTAHDDFSGADLVVSHLGDPGIPMQIIAGWEVPASKQVDVALLTRLINRDPSID